MSEAQVKEFLESTRVKTVEFLCFGESIMEAWYYSPYPLEYRNKVLYTCPFCLNFFRK
jgi:hypothetical protein